MPREWKGTTRLFDLGLRPEAIAVREPGGPGETFPFSPSLTAQVRRLEFNGPELLATLAVGPHRLVARLPASQQIQEGQRAVAILNLETRRLV